IELEVTLLDKLYNFTDLFNKEKASRLPLYRGIANHYIKLKEGLDRKIPELV
ncbi:hypothetical protein MYCTH_2031317, partial [Thermothelomyces thermophilus ATCC 42464]